MGALQCKNEEGKTAREELQTLVELRKKVCNSKICFFVHVTKGEFVNTKLGKANIFLYTY